MKTAEEILVERGYIKDDMENVCEGMGYDIIKAMEEYAQQFKEERDYYKEQWLEDLLEDFSQACWVKDIGKYDHMCLSTWEYSQKELIKHGIINPKQCYRL